MHARRPLYGRYLALMIAASVVGASASVASTAWLLGLPYPWPTYIPACLLTSAGWALLGYRGVKGWGEYAMRHILCVLISFLFVLLTILACSIGGDL